MDKVMKFVIEFVKSNKFKAFIWTTVNAFIALLIAQIGDINWEYTPFITAVLNALTKWINKKFISKYIKL